MAGDQDESSKDAGFSPHIVSEDSIQAAEQAITRQLQMTFAMWTVGLEMVRAGFEDWSTRNTKQFRRTLARLERVQDLDSAEKRAEAVSEIVTDQVEASFKSFAAAGYRAMTYAGAQGKQLSEYFKKAAEFQEGAARETQVHIEKVMEFQSRAMREAQAGIEEGLRVFNQAVTPPDRESETQNPSGSRSR